MQRGDIWLTDLEPVRASGANKRRPAVIVSNDRANAAAGRRGRGTVTVVPVTSNITAIYPFHTLLTAEDCGLRVDSKAQAEQVRAVSMDRLDSIIGRVPGHLMAKLDDALRLHLQL